MTKDLKQTSSVSKQPYQSPQLSCYGSLTRLTLAGSGTTNEATAMGTKCNSMRIANPICPSVPSDPALKENIELVCVHPVGLNLYLFDYKPAYREQWGHGRQFGVMADEVEAYMPEAVTLHPDGYKLVNYELLGIDRIVH